MLQRKRDICFLFNTPRIKNTTIFIFKSILWSALPITYQFTMHNYLKLVFSKLDKNGNGKVSAFELKIFISRMNMPHVDDFVEELDRNGDSQFTLEEFINLYLELLVRVNIIMYFICSLIWSSKFGGQQSIHTQRPSIYYFRKEVGGVRKMVIFANFHSTVYVF